MKPFVHAHATHPDAHLALALAAAQIEAQRLAQDLAPTLGWLYLCEPFAAKAEALLDELRQRWPGVAWVGASAPGICASGVEYFDEPALALMLAELPPAQFRVFSGRRPLAGWQPQAALVHADAHTPELQELLRELAGQTAGDYLFGGLAVGQRDALQIADGIWRGGLSGVGFGPGVALLSRVSQGCQALGPERRITACEGHLLQELDGQPALDCLLQDLTLPVAAGPAELREALPRLRRTLVGLASAGARQRREYGPEVLVRHLVGLDPARPGDRRAAADRPDPELLRAQPRGRAA
jgi:small ligand-binding sensory domain FIST